MKSNYSYDATFDRNTSKFKVSINGAPRKTYTLTEAQVDQWVSDIRSLGHKVHYVVISRR